VLLLAQVGDRWPSLPVCSPAGGGGPGTGTGYPGSCGDQVRRHWRRRHRCAHPDRARTEDVPERTRVDLVRQAGARPRAMLRSAMGI